MYDKVIPCFSRVQFWDEAVDLAVDYRDRFRVRCDADLGAGGGGWEVGGEGLGDGVGGVRLSVSGKGLWGKEQVSV